MANCIACDRLKDQFPGALRRIDEFRGETHILVDREQLHSIMTFLKDDEETLCNMLLDIVGVDTGSPSPRFRVVYLLHSMKYNNRLAVAIEVAEGEAADTLSDLWRAADWMEREVYDMFGITFHQHPNLRRILLPEDYVGHPMRKDYPLKGVDFDKPFAVCLERETPADA